MVKRFKSRNHMGRRWCRSFCLNLSKPYQWQRAKDYLTGEYKLKAAKVIWSGPIAKLL